ncbi:recombination regulator RecX [Moraxella sp. Tifton1]|uniref:regulatory protein RecX n=1 Tax=Moraxella oculi TaxID=2940516 RepID=UPI0020121769|nr:regulatory protein RecX [Moraxella sp. Tifton1]MCL1623098.1 recombination regulator RecX [Moraxella sp. Tifton1]
MTTIKTLAEILADMDNSVSAKPCQSSQAPLDTPAQKTHYPSTRPKQSHKTNPSINGINTLTMANTTPLDASTADVLKHVASEPIYQNDKDVNRLRWLAFYYLSRRELSQKQLRQKLLDKHCNPQMVEELLVEFDQKKYQSDERCALMIIRESVRRGRGKHHIAQSFKNAGINLPYSIDELIGMADIPSLSDGTILADDDTPKDGINWLKLAVEARCKKYGNHLPDDQKQKARQLRFLQYRGFEMSVCFAALNYTLDDMDELDFI